MKIKRLGANRTEMDLGDGRRLLFSYNTPVAFCTIGEDGTFAYLRTAEAHSVTTRKHIGQWLDGKQAQEMPQAFFDKLLQ